MNKEENSTIYEIYSACRLCGAGAGYKMPIIQSVVDLEGEDIELKEKIKKCLQIEVNHNDRMPPLICELCVDKVNDFFEFRKMCLRINKKTRLRLGLQLQAPHRGAPEPEEKPNLCEPVYVDSDSDEGEPLVQQAAPQLKPKPKPVKGKKESDIQIKIYNYQPVHKEKPCSPSPKVVEQRETRRKRDPSPKRSTRQNSDVSVSDLQGLKIPQRPAPKSLLKRDEKQKEVEKKKEDKSDDNSLLVPRTKKRPREVAIEAPPPAKKPNLAPEPSKPDKARPGPKSSKAAPKPPPPPPSPPQKQVKPATKMGPKSKKREPSPPPPAKVSVPVSATKAKRTDTSAPAAKSRTREISPALAAKAKKLEVPPPATTKAKKAEISPVTSAKEKRRDISPAASRSKKREVSPPKISRASPQPLKPFVCNICGTKAKAAQGLASHLKTHIPAITPIRSACNACELWFVTPEEAISHHRRHSNKGMPYTCNKCYDDFRTIQDYNLHFERNQCLPTYEVPDVKCEECWRYFPTYKLLEDHKCPGDAGRPGGKCSKCSRSYALMRHLVAHEMKCSVRTKEKDTPQVKIKSEPRVDPEVSSRLLPMEVRIARCDPLLKNARDDLFDVSLVSHRFGLDRNYNYPYFYSMGDIGMKRETALNDLDHMIAIKDEIKEEYFNNDHSFVHWDSDATGESGNEDMATGILFFKPSSKKKPVDTLSTISLKTIFSPKCLGKVPRKKRKIKSENAFESVLSIGFHGFPRDIRRNVDNIIDNLGDESQLSDNFGSDSILDKSKEKDTDSIASIDLFDSLKTNLLDSMDTSACTVEEAKEKDELDQESGKTDNAGDIISNKSENGSDVKCTSNNPNKGIDNQFNNYTSDITNASDTNSDDAAPKESPQESCEASEATDNSHASESTTNIVIQNNNDKLRNNTKNGILDDKIVSDKETLTIDDEVKNSISQIEESEPMDIDEEIKQKSDVEINAFDKSEVVNITENIVMETSEIDDSNAEKDVARSFVLTNDKENSDNIEETVDTLRIDSKSDTNNKTSDSNKTRISSSISFTDNAFVQNIGIVKSQESDKFNVNNVNDVERQFMAELDAQIGEDEPKSNLVGENGPQSSAMGENRSASDIIGGNRSASDIIGENKSASDIISENRSARDLIGENRPASDIIGEIRSASDIIGENRSASDVIGENKTTINENKATIDENKALGEVFEGNDATSAVNIDNTGFGDAILDKKDKILNDLMQKRDDDMATLDLDNISDEEFNFDL